MIKLVTDTSAGLPEPVIERYDIRVVPAALTFGGQRVRDGADITAGQLYEYLASGAADLPEPAAPAVGDFIAIYDQLIADAPTATIFSVHPAAALSPTLEAARRAAAEFLGADIRVVDSGSALLGQGIVVAAAADLARQGADAAAVEEALERWTTAVQVRVAVPAWPGESAAALLRLDSDGINVVSPCEDIAHAVIVLAEEIPVSYDRRYWIGVQQAANPRLGEGLSDELFRVSPYSEIYRSPISPLFGVTLGVGSVAAAWLPAE